MSAGGIAAAGRGGRRRLLRGCTHRRQLPVCTPATITCMPVVCYFSGCMYALWTLDFTKIQFGDSTSQLSSCCRSNLKVNVIDCDA